MTQRRGSGPEQLRNHPMTNSGDKQLFGASYKVKYASAQLKIVKIR